MGFKSYTYNVMIASPSDLKEERQVVTEAIHEWNDLNAEAEGIVLLPLLWEKHSTPEVGDRPQAIINKQLVARADLMIGLFWTKLGTSTGVAESGTVEEIQKMMTDGKQVMLYFSDRQMSPSKFDAKQMKKLKDFKSEIFAKAVCGKFESHEGLCRIIMNDLTRRIRTMKPSVSVGSNSPASGDDLSVTVSCEKSPNQGEGHIRTLIVDVRNLGDNLNNLGAVLSYKGGEGNPRREVLQAAGNVPDIFERNFSARFYINNSEPHQRNDVLLDHPNEVSIVIFSHARRVVEFPATEWLSALQQFVDADPSLPDKPQPRRRERHPMADVFNYKKW